MSQWYYYNIVFCSSTLVFVVVMRVWFFPPLFSKAPIPHKYPEEVTAAEAVTRIKSGDNIFVQGMAATPTLLTNAMTEHGKAEKLKVKSLMFDVLYILIDDNP